LRTNVSKDIKSRGDDVAQSFIKILWHYCKRSEFKKVDLFKRVKQAAEAIQLNREKFDGLSIYKELLGLIIETIKHSSMLFKKPKLSFFNPNVSPCKLPFEQTLKKLLLENGVFCEKGQDYLVAFKRWEGVHECVALQIPYDRFLQKQYMMINMAKRVESISKSDDVEFSDIEVICHTPS